MNTDVGIAVVCILIAAVIFCLGALVGTETAPCGKSHQETVMMPTIVGSNVNMVPTVLKVCDERR